MQRFLMLLALATLAFAGSLASADEYSDTVGIFKKAGESAKFFDNSYGYAVFPNIAKGGLGVGAAHGNGRVYEQAKYGGDTSMTQVSFGLQAGGQAYRQIVFFEDKRAFDEFTKGNFEFGAGVSAVAITAGVSGSTGTTGSSTSASGGQQDAGTRGKYNKGMAIFTVAKGGLMYEASVAGQKFSYKALAASK
ncbi:MAG: lipid-binding SYLF domain-containing protein [Proteobacteria bacterium]|nr:lipid-binding SYLF domain-containing protein [Pseudomonadota bacterium]